MFNLLVPKVNKASLWHELFIVSQAISQVTPLKQNDIDIMNLKLAKGLISLCGIEHHYWARFGPSTLLKNMILPKQFYSIEDLYRILLACYASIKAGLSAQILNITNSPRKRLILPHG